MSRFPLSISGIVTAAGDGLERAIPLPMACRIVACYITDTDGIAADNTDYVDSDITGTTGYDSRAANQGALTADTPVALTLSSNTVLAAGKQLKATIVKGGSGKATEAGITWWLEPAN